VKAGQRGETCTPAPSVPNGGCCCYTTRCLPRRLEGAGGLVRLDPDAGILETKSGGDSMNCRLPIADCRFPQRVTTPEDEIGDWQSTIGNDIGGRRW